MSDPYPNCLTLIGRQLVICENADSEKTQQTSTHFQQLIFCGDTMFQLIRIDELSIVYH